ncbi:flagellar biosynthetic protein FliP [Escherichia coli]|nr:flagellar biosynthetic protein FliP [Escherichia coli]
MRRLLSVAPVLLWLVTPLAFAQLPGITSQPLPGGGQSWSLPVQTLVFITSLTFIPAILLMMTSFTRIIIVFGLLRNALGTPSAPPNQVLLGLALFLTFFIMSPVIDKIYVDAYQPFSEEKISMQEALEKGAQPLREFMLRQTREADLGLFARLANTGPLQGPEPCRCAFCSRLRDQRVENRISDRLHDFHPFFDYRPGDCQRVDGIGDDDGPPRHHCSAL